MRTLILSLAVGALALAGCAVETASEPTATSTDEALSAFSTQFSGNYHRTDGGNALSALSLRTDGTFGRDDVVQCFRAPCPPIHTEGKWSVTGSSFAGTLKLTANGASTSYAALLDGAVASLELTSSSHTRIHEERIPATCGGIGALQCASGFTCVYPAQTYPDVAGSCLPRGAKGTMCGGIAAFQCMQGLSCVITATYPDAAGTCQ